MLLSLLKKQIHQSVSLVRMLTQHLIFSYPVLQFLDWSIKINTAKYNAVSIYISIHIVYQDWNQTSNNIPKLTVEAVTEHLQSKDNHSFNDESESSFEPCLSGEPATGKFCPTATTNQTEMLSVLIINNAFRVMRNSRAIQIQDFAPIIFLPRPF